MASATIKSSGAPFQGLRQTPEKAQRGSAHRHIGVVALVFAFQPFAGDALVQLVVAQIDQNRYALQTGHRTLHFQRVFAEGDIQRHRRTVAPLDQGVGLHHAVWQHGDFVTWHVNRGQACTPQLVDGAAG
jgi:hypothetical protein